MTLFSLLKTGGITVAVLMICSILSWTVALERIFYYWKKSRVKRSDFMTLIGGELKKGDMQRASQISADTDTPFAKVAHAGILLHGQGENAVKGAMERAVALETSELEKNIGITGTIGSVAVYIGLFGTVLGIIRAFHDISSSRSGGLSVVINGISEALICTAMGLAVAVPAVIIYNYFVQRIDRFVNDMQICASEVADLMKEKH